MTTHLRCLVVDDEALARQRLVRLLGDVESPACVVVAQAADAAQTIAALGHHWVDVVLLDIHMPGMDGMALARRLREEHGSAQVVFVTAHAEHALSAFELQATDYLTKPVRLERLQACMARVAALSVRAVVEGSTAPLSDAPEAASLVVQDARRTYRLDLNTVLVLKAELKYVSAFTADGEHVLSQSLAELELSHPSLFIRTHRNTLVLRAAMYALERGHAADAHDDEPGAEAWVLRVRGHAQPVQVSRRCLPSVRQALRGGGIG
jgi:two-component system, LytTR family, response regulator AlgR